MAEFGSVVVGVDGSEGSRSALQWAVDVAASHQSRLILVAAYAPPPPAIDPPFGSFPWGSDVEERQKEAAEQMLTETVRTVIGDNPSISVETRVVEGNAARVLINVSREADLLVVGSRGHGGFAGMLLGSVSQHVAAHAQCPVVIVR